MTLHTPVESTPAEPRPYTERNLKGAEFAWVLTRLGVPGAMSFETSEYGSGLRSAFDYFSGQAGTSAERVYPGADLPVIVVSSHSGETVELWKANPGRGSTWYALRKSDEGTYKLEKSGRVYKDSSLSVRAGDVVFVGWVGTNIADEPATPQDPSHELVRLLVIAAGAEQHGAREHRSRRFAARVLHRPK